TDTGIGMNKEKIDQILRLDSITSTKGTDGEKGTGLGLILCKEILEKQGGSMRIVSEENIGTTVTITLPYGNTVTRTDH
ncbi:MAG: ATP-binding protein, partial [bacterium]